MDVPTSASAALMIAGGANMAITIKVRLGAGAYHARAMRLGVTASSAEGAKAAAAAVCRKLNIDPTLLQESPAEPGVTIYSHPHQEQPA